MSSTLRDSSALTELSWVRGGAERWGPVPSASGTCGTDRGSGRRRGEDPGGGSGLGGRGRGPSSPATSVNGPLRHRRRVAQCIVVPPLMGEFWGRANGSLSYPESPLQMAGETECGPTPSIRPMDRCPTQGRPPPGTANGPLSLPPLGSHGTGSPGRASAATACTTDVLRSRRRLPPPPPSLPPLTTRNSFRPAAGAVEWR